VAEANPGENRTDPDARRKRWVKVAITLVLLLIVIVSGSAAMYSRQQWWEMYMRLTH
jgi:hypothetical protein